MKMITHMSISGLFLCKLRGFEFFERLTPLLRWVELSGGGVKVGKNKIILLVDKFEDMITHSCQLNERNNYYFKSSALWPIFIPLEMSFSPNGVNLSKNGQVPLLLPNLIVI